MSEVRVAMDGRAFFTLFFAFLFSSLWSIDQAQSMAAKPLRDFVPYARSTSEPVDFNYLEIVSYNVGNVGMDFRTPGASCPLFKLCWSWAVEGLRDWFESVSADIILLQETMGQSQVFWRRLVRPPRFRRSLRRPLLESHLCGVAQGGHPTGSARLRPLRGQIW